MRMPSPSVVPLATPGCLARSTASSMPHSACYRPSSRGGPQLRVRQSATRCLGWEARHEGWSGGDACSEETIGHTGFTGTGVWIDFRSGLCWALLTNRVHPTRHRDTGIDALRRRVGELVVAAVS